jgi:enamine deaminase RidA (YjgF/YER057c/UK114 family)
VREAINSPDYHVPIDGFSHVIRGRTGGVPLFVSGLTARTSDGTIVAEGDAAGQLNQILTNLREILSVAGATLDDVVSIRTYVLDITAWSDLEPVMRQFWGDIWPASTLVEVRRLFDTRHLIEVESVALIDPQAS